jgi:hypothetical protein
LNCESSPEECLGGCDVPLGAQQEIDGLSLFVDGTVEIDPASFDFDVGFVVLLQTSLLTERAGAGP